MDHNTLPRQAKESDGQTPRPKTGKTVTVIPSDHHRVAGVKCGKAIPELLAFPLQLLLSRRKSTLKDLLGVCDSDNSVPAITCEHFPK